MAQININKSALVAFITKAKQNTYAKSGEGEEKILADGSKPAILAGKELIFKQGNFKYRDRYFGFNPFAGQEVIFLKGQAIWAMNYYGQVVLEAVSTKQIYTFLKQALKKVTIDSPFRGPDNFSEGDFRYANKPKGGIKKFKGCEKIFYKDKLVYRLDYFGGLILANQPNMPPPVSSNLTM